MAVARRRRGFPEGADVVTVHGGKGTFPLADINNDDPRDLLYLIAKSIAFPLSNMFLGGTGENGEVVLAINPMWAERFAAAFPDVEELQAYLREHAWQPIDLWPAVNQEILRAKGRVDDEGRVRLVDRPDQIVPVVCGGLGSLHAVALPSFGESQMQSAEVVRGGERRTGSRRRWRRWARCCASTAPTWCSSPPTPGPTASRWRSSSTASTARTA